jgi:hypothetical protein
MIVVTKLVGGGRIGMRRRQGRNADELVRLSSSEVSVREIHLVSRCLWKDFPP